MPLTNWQVLLCALPLMLLLTSASSMINVYKRPLRTFLSMFSSTNHIQRIYDALHPLSTPDIEQLARQPDNSEAINKCLGAVDSLTLEDVGLSADILSKVRDSVCMNIFSCKNFHLAVFIIPKGFGIPLHDHPNVSYHSSLAVFLFS